MIDFLQETVNYVNFPVTMLLICMLLYWLMVILGVLGMDAIDIDLGLDADVDVSLDADIDLDANVELDGGSIDAPATSISGGGGSTTTGGESFLRSVFEYFYLSEIPVVIVASFLVFYFWIVTLITNHYTNPDEKLSIALAWLIPNLFVSLAILRFTMIPMAILFRKPPPENKTRDELIGIVGRVTTTEVTDSFGQLEIKKLNEPEIILNVRCRPEVRLVKNEQARIVLFDLDDGTFLVEPTNLEIESDE